VKPLFERFEQLLVDQGYEARRGQMVDATLVNVPIQRNFKEEHGPRMKTNRSKRARLPKTGRNRSVAKKTPPKKHRQKNTDARHTKKRKKSFLGYKNHANVDAEHKIIRDYIIRDYIIRDYIIRDYEVTAASVHDSQVFTVTFFERLLVPAESNPDVYADSAYRSKETEKVLEQARLQKPCSRAAHARFSTPQQATDRLAKRSPLANGLKHESESNTFSAPNFRLAGDLVLCHLEPQI